MSGRSRIRFVAAALLQVVVMAAVVATLVYLPVGVAVALALRAFGVSFEAWLTLGQGLHPSLGLLVGWLFLFLGSCGYAAWLFPWSEEIFGGPARD